jgi:hypothetical protein
VLKKTKVTYDLEKNSSFFEDCIELTDHLIRKTCIATSRMNSDGGDTVQNDEGETARARHSKVNCSLLVVY